MSLLFLGRVGHRIPSTVNACIEPCWTWWSVGEADWSEVRILFSFLSGSCGFWTLSCGIASAHLSSRKVVVSGYCLVVSLQFTFLFGKSWSLDTVLWESLRFAFLFGKSWFLDTVLWNRIGLPFSSESRGFWTLLCGIASVYLTFRKVVVSARYLVASLQFTFLFASYGFWTPVQ